MGEPPPRDVSTHLVDDPEPRERAAWLTELLAAGIERWLRKRGTVDFGGDVSVHPGMGPDGRPW